jgi:hypothetical protein
LLVVQLPPASGFPGLDTPGLPARAGYGGWLGGGRPWAQRDGGPQYPRLLLRHRDAIPADSSPGQEVPARRAHVGAAEVAAAPAALGRWPGEGRLDGPSQKGSGKKNPWKLNRSTHFSSGCWIFAKLIWFLNRQRAPVPVRLWEVPRAWAWALQRTLRPGSVRRSLG